MIVGMVWVRRRRSAQLPWPGSASACEASVTERHRLVQPSNRLVISWPRRPDRDGRADVPATHKTARPPGARPTDHLRFLKSDSGCQSGLRGTLIQFATARHKGRSAVEDAGFLHRELGFGQHAGGPELAELGELGKNLACGRRRRSCRGRRRCGMCYKRLSLRCSGRGGHPGLRSLGRPLGLLPPLNAVVNHVRSLDATAAFRPVLISPMPCLRSSGRGLAGFGRVQRGEQVLGDDPAVSHQAGAAAVQRSHQRDSFRRVAAVDVV